MSGNQMNAELPYAGTEGFVGRPASIDRARRNAQEGIAAERQDQVLEYLASIPLGAIWIEVGEALRLHHGQVSSSLSVLHQAGKVFQLRVKRGRSHPYVHADWRHLYVAAERYDEPTRTNVKLLRERNEEAEALLDSALAQWFGEPDTVRNLVMLALKALRGDDA
jgi:hypothetical protein